MKIKNNKIDMMMEIICLISLAGITLFLIINWASIPEKVPMHYDWAGNINRWGSKAELVILPIISWMLYLFITAMEQFPTMWNTGVTVTEENQERVYRTLKYMVKSLKLIMVLDFTVLNICSITGRELPGWFLIVFLGAVFGDLIIWIIRLMKVK